MTTPRIWKLAHGRSLRLDAAIVMGILNVTPDSFSDGGLYSSAQQAVERAVQMAREGAAIIDIGGESTRPSARPLSASEEQDRILPVIEKLSGHPDMLLSVDTYRPETARLAITAGVHILNDVTGLGGGPELAEIAAQTGAGLVIMHTGRGRRKLPDAIADQHHFLGAALEKARGASVADEQIVLDPGFGFAKETPEDNLDLIARFEELHGFGLPLAVGTSRKRFIGAVTDRPADQRAVATAATSAILRMKGAVIFRVHDVAANVDALRMTDAILSRSEILQRRQPT